MKYHNDTLPEPFSLTSLSFARDPHEKTRNPIQEYDFLPRGGQESCNLQTSVTERSYSWDVSLAPYHFSSSSVTSVRAGARSFFVNEGRIWRILFSREKDPHTKLCSSRVRLWGWSKANGMLYDGAVQARDATKLLERRLNEAQSRWIAASNMQDSRCSSTLYKMHRCNVL